MMMPPPYKPLSRNDSLSDDPMQVPRLAQRTNSDGVLEENHSFDNIAKNILTRTASSGDSSPRLLSPSTRLPPALQPLKVASTALKTSGSVLGGQTGPRSVFFTSTKFMGANAIPGQVVRANSPTTNAHTTFVLPQNRDKQNNGSMSPSNPPTLLFHPSQQVRQSPLMQHPNQVKSAQPPPLHSYKTTAITSLIPSGQVLSQAGIVVHPGQTVPQPKMFSNDQQKELVATSPAQVSAASVAMLQTVSVIKQQQQGGFNKQFTSITDILSSKEIKSEKGKKTFN